MPSSADISNIISLCQQFVDACANQSSESSHDTVSGLMSQIYEKITESYGKDLASSSVAVIKSRLTKSSGIRPAFKAYLTSLISLVDSANNDNLEIYLGYCWQIAGLFMIFNKLPYQLITVVIKCWGLVDSHSVRVRSFLLAHKLLKLGDDDFAKKTLKKFFTCYMQNTKFVTEHSLPFVNFMVRSLCELFAIRNVLAYQYTFVYVRQMAIRLRSAITSHEAKEMETVRSWQFVCSLRLWTNVVCSHSGDEMRLLVHPLVQIITASIKLFNSARFIPLRFHLIELLNMLGWSSGMYVPALGLVMEVFDLVDFNKKRKNVKLGMSAIIHFSDSQIRERSFVDCVVGAIEAGIVESAAIHAQSMAFPELVVPVSMKLRKFLKRCKVPEYYRRFKSVLGRIDENSEFVKSKRTSRPNMECNDINEETPLSLFYKKWKKEKEKTVDLTGKKRKKVKEPLANKKVKLKELEVSDSDSEFIVNK